MPASRFSLAAAALVLLLGACHGAEYRQWNSRGVSLSVTKEGAVNFYISERVMRERGCNNDLRCYDLIELMAAELEMAGQCPYGYTTPYFMSVGGYANITTRCKPEPEMP